jgi:hypothetical protein
MVSRVRSLDICIKFSVTRRHGARTNFTLVGNYVEHLASIYLAMDVTMSDAVADNMLLRFLIIV